MVLPEKYEPFLQEEDEERGITSKKRAEMQQQLRNSFEKQVSTQPKEELPAGYADAITRYSFGPAYLVVGDGFGWFRVFGYGLRWKDLRKRALLFSEREGYSRGKQVGNWYIGTVPR